MIRALLLAAILASPALSQDIPVLSVCEVLAQATRYNGRMVMVTGIDSGTDEGSWLRGEECPEYQAGGRTWKAIVWVASPQSADRRVDFAFDVDSLARSIAQFRRLRRNTLVRCIAVTYTGIFETRTDWDAFTINYPDGRVTHVGFGHLGAAPAQLIMKSVDSVARIPGCR